MNFSESLKNLSTDQLDLKRIKMELKLKTISQEYKHAPSIEIGERLRILTDEIEQITDEIIRKSLIRGED